MKRRTALRSLGAGAAALVVPGIRGRKSKATEEIPPATAATSSSSETGAPGPLATTDTPNPDADGTGTGGDASPTPDGTLLPGTPHETGVYVAGASNPGPTALVVGGVHGDEIPGYRAAARFVGVGPTVGTVVVVPRANRVAIEAGTRAGEGGDLNRNFPTGAEPTTPLARALWSVVERRDPDVVVDLHRSVGLYRYHDAAVGQAIFPTDAGDAPAVADDVTATLNRTTVPWSMPLHDFRRGNVLTGSSPLLIHKVAGDLARPGYIVEVTRFLVDTETGTDWATRAAVELLAHHGVRYGASTPASGSGGWRWS